MLWKTRMEKRGEEYELDRISVLQKIQYADQHFLSLLMKLCSLHWVKVSCYVEKAEQKQL